MADKAKTNILVGVTGGIAAYKSPDLVRRLRERGADVQVVLTAGGARFVTPLTFQAVSGHPVRGSLFDEQAEAAMGHIELARWANAIVVAPASAEFLASLAAGQASSLLLTLCLATRSPIVVVPSMNREMWLNPATQANCALLAQRGIEVMHPDSGDQACGEIGPGRMPEPLAIAEHLAARFLKPRRLEDLDVLVTAGPTREAIDPVRYLSNRSSGKMGFAVARAAAEAGARVHLVAGPVSLNTPPGVERIDVESARDMCRAVRDRAGAADIFIAAAAVADFESGAPAAQKLKKSGESMSLELQPAPDTLATVAAMQPAPFTVGFAAETEAVEANARKKLVAKKLDMIAANEVGPDKGFERDDNELLVLWQGGGEHLVRAPKIELARRLVSLIDERYRTRGQAA